MLLLFLYHFPPTTLRKSLTKQPQKHLKTEETLTFTNLNVSPSPPLLLSPFTPFLSRFHSSDFCPNPVLNDSPRRALKTPQKHLITHQNPTKP